MAEAFGIAAGTLTVLELTTKVIKQCKSLIETAHDAPRDLKHIFIEISSLKAVLKSFEFLSHAEFSDTAQGLAGANGLVEGCRGTVDELSKELDKLSLANSSHVTPGKRQRIKGSVQWCLKESKTRKLLDEAMQHKSTLTLALLGEITSDIKGIKGTVEQVHDNLTKTERRKMCDWIEHTNPTPIHNRSLKNHEEHTCQWIHRVEQWKDWLQLQRRLIWIHGIPGAGKTVLASYLIQLTIKHCEIQNNDRAACLYYYCSFLHGQEKQRDEAFPFLCWVVSQLCRRCDYIPLHLIPLYRKNNVPSFQDLEVALQNLLINFDVLYIMVDAVDESNPRNNVLKFLQDIVTQPNYAKIQLLVTSRRYSDIEEVLRPLSEPTLPMSNAIVDADIRTYVDTIIQQNKYFPRWPETLRNEIVESLIQGAQGMFRWVVCQIDRLQRKSPRQAREAIKCLPQTLEETYEAILLEIPRDDWPTPRTALQWISGHSDLQFSYGIPANCLSLAVLGINQNPELGGDEDNHEHEFLKVILGCLVELDLFDDSDCDEEWPFGYRPGDEDSANICFHTVSLAHYTIQEFLFSDRVKMSAVSYFTMSRNACAQTMLETVLQPITRAEYSFLNPYGYDAFESYCYSTACRGMSFWETFIIQNDTFWHQYHDFFDKHRYSWRNLCYVDGYNMEGISVIEFEPTINPTAMEGQYFIALLESHCVDMLEKLMEKLSLESILSVSVPLRPDSWLWSKRSAANDPGFSTILDVFGAFRITYGDWTYRYLVKSLRSKMELPKLFLFHLRAHYHEAGCQESCVIADLLDAGANANSPGCCLTALQIVVRNWDYTCVKILLEWGADPNSVGQPGGYIPTHFDTTWAQASPLHILRNAEYGFMAMEFCTGLKVERAKKWSHIEALLLEYGAKDFVLSEPRKD